MRLLATAIPVLLIALTSLALDNNNPEKWISPNKKYAIKEAFYGEVVSETSGGLYYRDDRHISEHMTAN